MTRREFIGGAAALAATPAFAKRTEDIRAVFLPWGHNMWGEALPEGVEAQTRQSLANIQAILDEAGFAKSDIVKTTVFIKNMNDFAAVNAVYADFFGEARPARSCVEVARLPKDGLVEIEFVAVKG